MAEPQQKPFVTDYVETSRDLLKRIDLHARYGAKDIDVWTIDLLKPAPGMRILDIACGAGKLCFLFDQHTRGGAQITGGDVSADLLEKARAKKAEKKSAIEFMPLNFNDPLPFRDGAFDLVTSAFAIYYAQDLVKTFSEVKRVLKPGGRFFVSGPLPENKKMFYDIIVEATGAKIPLMPGSSRFKTEVLGAVKTVFGNAELNVFENPLTFPEAAPFMEYVRASLSEDRNLWKDLFSGQGEYEAVISKIDNVARKWQARDGRLVMTKVVGGIVAAK
jgi:ubiquinone/menaquinone biosynthesis C-methylase UbiE